MLIPEVMPTPINIIYHLPYLSSKVFIWVGHFHWSSYVWACDKFIWRVISSFLKDINVVVRYLFVFLSLIMSYILLVLPLSYPSTLNKLRVWYFLAMSTPHHDIVKGNYLVIHTIKQLPNIRFIPINNLKQTDSMTQLYTCKYISETN